MRTCTLSFLLLLASLCLFGCVEVEEDAMPDTVIVEDIDPPEEVEIDVDINETP